MRFRLRCSLMTCLLVSPLSTTVLAAEKITDSTGWHQVSNGRVTRQTYQSAKLPTDTLLVTFKAEGEDSLVYLVNQNLMLIKTHMVFLAEHVMAFIPDEIRWYRTWRGHLEWTKRGRGTKLFRLPSGEIKIMVYHSHDGSQWVLTPAEADVVRPMYQPSRLSAEPVSKKKRRFLFF